MKRESALEIKGSRIIVTGACQGLGLAIAEYLQQHGATVIVVDRDAEGLEKLPPGFIPQLLDATQPEEARAAVKSLSEQYGKIDALVNNAGVIYSEPFVNIMKPESMMHNYTKFRDTVTANLDTVFIMTSAVVEHMVLQRTKGVIINISSISACGNEGQTAYSAAKAGVNAMTVTWSKELARFGIRCNAVAPGFIGTDSTHQALSESAIKHILLNTPLRRLGKAEEVAKAVATLIDNDFLNGVILNLDGGLRI